jgi:hypothetical protein
MGRIRKGIEVLTYDPMALQLDGAVQVLWPGPQRLAFLQPTTTAISAFSDTCLISGRV